MQQKNILGIELKNVLVLKEKTSEFIEEVLKKNDTIASCELLRVLRSGNYFIFTFKIDNIDQKNALKEIQDNWI